MLQRIAAILLLAFLAVIGVDWPALPLGASIADIVFIPMAIAILMTGVPRLSWHRADTALVLYLLGALPAIAISADQTRSALEFIRELYVAAIYVIIASATRQGFASTIGKGLALGGALMSIAGLAFVGGHTIGLPMWAPMGEVMQLPYLGATLRLRATAASEAMFACVLTAAMPFAITAYASDRRPMSFIAVASMCAAVMLTFSHAIAGFAVAIVIVSWPMLSRSTMLRRSAVAAAIVIVVAFNFAATISLVSMYSGLPRYAATPTYHYAVEHRITRIGDFIVTYNVMSYARIKQVAWRAFTEHPIAGVGLDQFHRETERAYKEGWLTAAYRDIDPHSSAPGRFAECGLIGGVTLLLLWVMWISMARDVARACIARAAAPNHIALAAAAALAGLLVSSLNADIMNFRFLWVVVGLIRGLHDASGMEIASGRDVTTSAGRD